MQEAIRAGVHSDRAQRSVCLVGFMGAGKTSVGRALGRRLHWPFEDLDDRIETKAGCSIEELFRVSGEAGFRRIESAALRELATELRNAPKVIALGGGAWVDPQNAALIEQLKLHTVFLDAPVEELLRRCRQEPRVRPLCQDAEQFRRLYEARLPSYLTAACRVETHDKEVEIIAAEVACSLGL